MKNFSDILGNVILNCGGANIYSIDNKRTFIEYCAPLAYSEELLPNEFVYCIGFFLDTRSRLHINDYPLNTGIFNYRILLLEKSLCAEKSK